jgi:hypothetical protein
LRIYAKHKGASAHPVTDRVQQMLAKESEAGITTLEYYYGFQNKAMKVKLDLLDFLLTQKKSGKTVAAYGAAAKGNTLLNYCGIKNDMISFIADANPHKRGKYLPGSHIPVVSEVELKNVQPDFVIILPWNLETEILEQLAYIKEWGGSFVFPIPAVKII